MKFHYLKAYGFAVIGVFHTSGPLVAGQYVKMIEASANSHGSKLFVKRFGLEVEITPPVMTNNDGTLRDPQPISKKGYTIKLLITRTQTASVRQHGMARITPERYKASLLDRVSSWLPVHNMDRECTTKQLIKLDVYCTTWKKTWESLKESIEWKELYVYPETSINPEVYFSENVGAYTLIGTFTMALTTGSSWLIMDIEFLQHSYHNQKVTFQFDHGATQVPPEIFEEIGNNKDLGLRLTEDGHYEGDCLQLDAFMAKHSTSRHPLDLVIKHGEKTLVRLLAHQSFISQNIRCGFLIEYSQRTGEWVMGSSLLKAYTAIVNPRNQILWMTFCPKKKGRSTKDI